MLASQSAPDASLGDRLPAAAPVRPRGTPRPSKRSVWRAVSLLLVHVAVLVHLAHWRISGSTLTPVEPSEAMQTFELGYVNAGFVMFVLATLATLVLGRFFCGWACHVVAYQDGAAWLLGKLGLRPRPIRSRLLIWVPLGAALYMFVWPTLARWMAGREFGGFRAHFRTDDFWATFPGPGIAALTLFVDGCLIVYLLGAKGFCTYGCPYGAVFGLADRASRGRIRVTDACEGCGHCSAVCTSNVLVHLEVARYRQVVDPGCMKCMDCVSVCPKDALYFGFGESRGAALARKHAKTAAPRRAFDFSMREEFALAVSFLASFFALRGLYDLIPFLLAIGLAVISACLTVLGWRVLRRPRVMFQARTLVADGRRNSLGLGLLIGLLLWWVFLGHSAWVQFHAARGRWLLLDAIAMPASERAQTLSASLAHLDRATAWGLVPVAQLEFLRGQILARQGEPEKARVLLSRALQLDPKLHAAALELADLALASTPPDLQQARERLEQILAARPAHALARPRLAALELRAAQSARAAGQMAASEAHLLRAVELAPQLSPAWLDLSDLLMSKSPPDLEGARAALRSLQSADPQNAEAQRRLDLLDQRFGPAR